MAFIFFREKVRPFPHLAKPVNTTFRKDEKSNGNETVMARENEAVFHSFMPTNNRVNIPLKINGDFSTDP